MFQPQLDRKKQKPSVSGSETAPPHLLSVFLGARQVGRWSADTVAMATETSFVLRFVSQQSKFLLPGLLMLDPVSSH